VNDLITEDIRQKKLTNTLESSTLFRENSAASIAFRHLAMIKGLPFLFFTVGSALDEFFEKVRKLLFFSFLSNPKFHSPFFLSRKSLKQLNQKKVEMEGILWKGEDSQWKEVKNRIRLKKSKLTIGVQ